MVWLQTFSLAFTVLSAHQLDVATRNSLLE